MDMIVAIMANITSIFRDIKTSIVLVYNASETTSLIS